MLQQLGDLFYLVHIFGSLISLFHLQTRNGVGSKVFLFSHMNMFFGPRCGS